MTRKKVSQIVRRSVALPRGLVDEVTALAPKDARNNLNRLVTIALREFAAREKARAFEEAMTRMSSDPAIRTEDGLISKEFRICESDGLKDD